MHYAYYEKDAKMGDPITGWGRVLLVKELSMVLPKPGPEAAAKLLQTWQENFQGIVSEQKRRRRHRPNQPDAGGRAGYPAFPPLAGR